MTAEQAYKFYHGYKLMFAGRYDPRKYKWNLPNLPVLSRQPDRHFYSRLAHKLNDAEIHALYTVGFFHKVNAYIADLMTPDLTTAAMDFVARGEKGRVQLETDLYELSKTLEDKDIDAWLYGDIVDGKRTLVPECLQMVVDRELDLDVAALVLLIPQPRLGFNWSAEMQTRDDVQSFGPVSLPRKLETADRLINYNRPGWRCISQSVAADFWRTLGVPDNGLAPAAIHTKPSLFE